MGFGTALKSKWKCVAENAASFSKFSLSFSVQTFDSPSNLGWKGEATRIVYVDLKDDDKDYRILKDKNSVDIIS